MPAQCLIQSFLYVACSPLEVDLVSAHSISQISDLRASGTQTDWLYVRHALSIDGAIVPLRLEDLRAVGQVSSIYDPQTFLFRFCILLTIKSIDAIISSGEAPPSSTFWVASFKLVDIALVSLSIVLWATLKLRRMSSRGTLRRGASRMSWLSGTSFVWLPTIFTAAVLCGDSYAYDGRLSGLTDPWLGWVT